MSAAWPSCRPRTGLLEWLSQATRQGRSQKEASQGNVKRKCHDVLIAGGVDCDVHPAVPHLTSLLPYLNDYWRDQVTTRGMVDLVSQSYPQNSPIASRPDWRP